MRLRKLLLATGAIVAAGAIALAPAAMASAPISNIDVGGPITRSIDLTLKSGSVQTKVFGIVSTAPCVGGTTVIGSGTVIGGTTGLSPNPAMVLNTLAPVCSSFFPGTTAAYSLTCAVNAVFADIVNTGLSDVAVDGTLQATNGSSHCIRVVVSNGCTFTVGDNADLQFNESPGLNAVQELTVSGGNLKIKSFTPSCLGAFVIGQPVTINAVFVVSALGYFPIDFQ